MEQVKKPRERGRMGDWEVYFESEWIIMVIMYSVPGQKE